MVVDTETKALRDGAVSLVAFASSDKTLPMLTCLHMRAGEGEIILTATDRYVLGCYRVEFDTERVDLPEGGANVNARELATFLKSCDKSTPLSLKVEGEYLTVTSGWGSDVDKIQRFYLYPGDFPAIERLLRSPEALPDAARCTTYSAKNLAKFSTVITGEKSPSMRTVNRGDSKPTLVLIGDVFAGLIVPILFRADGRDSETGDNVPSWVDTSTRVSV